MSVTTIPMSIVCLAKLDSSGFCAWAEMQEMNKRMKLAVVSLEVMILVDVDLAMRIERTRALKLNAKNDQGNKTIMIKPNVVACHMPSSF